MLKLTLDSNTFPTVAAAAKGKARMRKPAAVEVVPALRECRARAFIAETTAELGRRVAQGFNKNGTCGSPATNSASSFRSSGCVRLR
jgi:hypothetical protein